jgi:hypothetical protein
MPTSQDFWELSKTRLEDAEGLIGIGRWSCTYYIAGYAVECALKALILRSNERFGTIFEDKKSASQFVDGFFVHELERLFKTAGLEEAFGRDRGTNPLLDEAWKAVRDWRETSRYHQKSQQQAESLVQAINHDPNGVMKWIRDHW